MSQIGLYWTIIVRSVWLAWREVHNSLKYIHVHKISLPVFVELSKYWSGHVSSSLWSDVSKVTCLLVHYLFVKSKSTLTDWVSEWVTRSPIELFWTAKNKYTNTNIKVELGDQLIFWLTSKKSRFSQVEANLGWYVTLFEPTPIQL